MKKIKAFFVFTAGFWLIYYLLFSFGNADFNIANWDIRSRALSAFFAFMTMCVILGITFGVEDY